MLDVEQASQPGREELLLVGDPVTVRIGVLPDFVRVGLLREDRILAEWRDEAREDQVIDEDVVRFVDAVAVLVLMHRNAADRIELAGGVGVLHVAANLEHEHPAVAVECNLRGLLNVGIAQHRFELEPGLHPDLLGFVGGREHRHGALLREVRFPHRRAAAGKPSLPAGGRGRLRLLRRLLLLGNGGKRECENAAREDESAACTEHGLLP